MSNIGFIYEKSKISSAQMQSFVDGALVAVGFRGILFLVRGLAAGRVVTIISSLIVLALLPLGFGLFLGRSGSVSLAKTLLWVLSLLQGGFMMLWFFHVPGVPHITLDAAAYFVGTLILAIAVTCCRDSFGESPAEPRAE